MQMRTASVISTGLHVAALLFAVVSFTGKPLACVGGGDTELATDETGSLYFIDLTLANFSAMVAFARAQGTALTIAVKKHITPYAFGDIHFEGHRVTGIDEKPDIVKFILAGIYVMTPEIFDHIPERQYFGMDTLIKNLLAGGKPVAKYEIEEYWLDIGQIDHYQEAQQAYDTHFASSEQ